MLTINQAVPRIRDRPKARRGAPTDAPGTNAMTTARQLYSLQELDLALARVDEQKARAEAELGLGPAVGATETALQEELHRLGELRLLVKGRQLEVESQRARSGNLDSQLYGESIANFKDLAVLEKEASNVREQLQRQDAELLELSVQVEESQERCRAMEENLVEARIAWEARQAELTLQVVGLSSKQTHIKGNRVELAATLEPVALQQYERLRLAKGGLAVAKVERGLCHGCRMHLPTQQQQRVKNSRQRVLCPTCGRILFLS